MANMNKALMTHYIEGSIISRDLENMMHTYNAEVRFDLELANDLEAYIERKHTREYDTRNRRKQR